jgi:hypothetical protein
MLEPANRLVIALAQIPFIVGDITGCARRAPRPPPSGRTS